MAQTHTHTFPASSTHTLSPLRHTQLWLSVLLGMQDKESSCQWKFNHCFTEWNKSANLSFPMLPFQSMHTVSSRHSRLLLHEKEKIRECFNLLWQSRSLLSISTRRWYDDTLKLKTQLKKIPRKSSLYFMQGILHVMYVLYLILYYLQINFLKFYYIDRSIWKRWQYPGRRCLLKMEVWS